LILWVDVNEHEGWMQKAGQLPGPALPEEIAVAESGDGESIGSNRLRCSSEKLRR
jgi:hypothetical protein